MRISALLVAVVSLALGPDAIDGFKMVSRRHLLSTVSHSLAVATVALTNPGVAMADDDDDKTLPSPAAVEDAAAAPDAAPVPQKPTEAQINLKSFNAGTRRLSEEGIGEGDLVGELLRRTEANKQRNAAIVKQSTEANAFTAIDGSVSRRLVLNLDGTNSYLDAKQIRELTVQRRLACAPSVMEPCRMVSPSAGAAAPPLQLPATKELKCDVGGRNCKFATSD